MESKKTCFAITPIGKPDSDTRRYTDKVYKHLICKAANACDYEVVRADKISVTGQITTQIYEQLLNADVVIADLTGLNPNVFYELAIRHAARKPFLQLIKDGDEIPFDVAGLRTIPYDISDPDLLESAQEECIRQLKAIDEGKPISYPITGAIDLSALRDGDNPADRSAAQILDAIAALKVSSDQNLREIRHYLYKSNMPSKAHRSPQGISCRECGEVSHPMIDSDGGTRCGSCGNPLIIPRD